MRNSLRTHRISSRLALFLLALFTFTGQSFAQQPADLDMSFNPTDVGYGNGADGELYCSAVQTDGKVLVSGYFKNFAGTPVKNLARLTTTGLPDLSLITGSGPDSTVRQVAVQPDGKIIIAGAFRNYNGVPAGGIARLLTDGALDTSFHSGTGIGSWYDEIRKVKVLPNGQIFIGGTLSSYNGETISNLARLNADGTLDTTFTAQPSGMQINDLDVRADGKLVIGGFLYYASPTTGMVRMLNADGSYNPSLLVDVIGEVKAVSLQPDGKVVVGGDFTVYQWSSLGKLVRYDTNTGSLDYTFTPQNFHYYGAVAWVKVQTDGKILLAGSVYLGPAGGYDARMTRLLPNGDHDPTFTNGYGASFSVGHVSQQPDGKFIVTGSFTSYDFEGHHKIVRLEENGPIDTTFCPNTSANGMVTTIVQQPDGKILIGGPFTRYNNIPLHGIGRLESNGSLDTSFNPGTTFNGGIEELVLQPDGKVIAAGWFVDTALGYMVPRIARLHANGTLDTGFDTGTGPDNYITGLALQPDGKVVVGGNFSNFNGISRRGIARLNTDGSLDMSFDPGTGFEFNPGPSFHPEVSTIALQPDGKILAGGWFLKFNNISRKGITRLNTDGSLDTSFNPGGGGITNPSTGQSQVYNILVQPDGKIIINGNFSHYLNTPRERIARLHANGTLDTGFTPDLQGQAFTSAIQPDGKILLGGYIYTVNGVWRSNIARLDSTGTLDQTFFPGKGPGYIVHALILQSDGKILIGGEFVSYQNSGRNHLARLLGGDGTGITTGPVAAAAYCLGATVPVSFTAYGAYQPGNVFTAQLSDSTGQFSSPVTIGSVQGLSSGVISAQIPAATTPASGYRIRVVASSPVTISPDNGSNLAVTPGIATNIVATASPDSIAPGALLTLFVSNPDSSLTYTWVGPDLNQATGDTVTANPTATGNLVYQVYAGNTSCSDTTTVTVVVDAGLFVQINNWNWATSGGGGNGRFAAIGDGNKQLLTGEAGIAIAADAAGNTATLGRFIGSATFGTTTLTSQGSEDIVLISTNAGGQVQWVRQFGGASGEEPKSIALDAAGNSYSCGSFSGAVTFGTSTLTATGTQDVFLVKHSVSGTVDWVRSIGGSGTMVPTQITADTQGNTTLTGYFTGTVSIGTFSLVSAGNSDAFIARYNTAGDVVWAKKFGSTNADAGFALAADAQANSYLTGTFKGSINFGSTTLTSPGSSFGRFFCKLDAAGNVVWAKLIGTAATPEQADALATDANGNAYLAGSFTGTTLFGTATLTSAGGTDAYLLYYNSDGDFIWAKRAGGAADEVATGIAVDHEGFCYLTGSYSGHAFFGTKALGAIGGADIFVAKYDQGGNCMWARKAGGIGTDAAAAVAVDSLGNSYLTGSFEKTATFGLTSIVTSHGMQDLFISKLGHIHALGSEEVAAGVAPEVVVFPNPFSTGFSVVLTAAKPGKTEVSLLDVLGRTVFSRNFELSEGEQVLPVQPAQALPQGVYLLQVRQDNLVQTLRVVKQ